MLTSLEINILPSSAIDSKREAILTPSPKISLFSKITSPICMPTRIFKSLLVLNDF